jgi:aldose sugar dehydrogenase
MAFLGDNDFLVVEKTTGNVKHVVNGAVQGVALDLAVNSASERGLLGIALHPDFPANPGVYLFWSCRAPAPPASDPFTPTQQRCSDVPETGADTNATTATPLIGNRVDRFIWNGSTLTFDRNLLQLRTFQADGGPEPPGQGDQGQPARANHNGGVITFGQDGKLYVAVGDEGRRGQMQNLADGPTPPTADDQFGGPAPDDAHLTGVVLRVNDDGSTPADNPFFGVGAEMGGAVGANIQRVFAYGLRNSFGLAVDPVSGDVWDQQNADDAFDEINRVEPGMNGGWVQFMGPVSRFDQWKQIEATLPPAGQLQQARWPVSKAAGTAQEALSRLYQLPGSHYSDPEFSWKFAVPPAGIGFLDSTALGPQYKNDLFAGAATPATDGGYLFRFNLTGNRDKIAVDDPRLEDRVADNNAKNDITESESLRFGSGFGVGTDVETGPNGNLYVVSLSTGSVYEIFRK